jgi:hypothetical protein
LTTDRQSYESGDNVTVSGNVGKELAPLINDFNPLLISIHNNAQDMSNYLEDHITNVSSTGDFRYTFQVIGPGALHSGRFAVEVKVPLSEKSFFTYFNFTFNQQKAEAANPMPVNWDRSATKTFVLKTYDVNYLSNHNSITLSFSKTIRYMVTNGAVVTNITAYHFGNNPGVFNFALMKIDINSTKSGTMTIELPIDIVESTYDQFHGINARDLQQANHASPFQISFNEGSAQSGGLASKLLFANETESVISFGFTPSDKQIEITGKSYEQIPEFPFNSSQILIASLISFLIFILSVFNRFSNSRTQFAK